MIEDLRRVAGLLALLQSLGARAVDLRISQYGAHVTLGAVGDLEGYLDAQQVPITYALGGWRVATVEDCLVCWPAPRPAELAA